MSHFLVMVIGDDPEKQLAPYHEFECTGRDDEYVVDVDKTGEALALFHQHAGKDNPIDFAEFAADWYGLETVLEGAPIDVADKHKFGYIVVHPDGTVVRVVDRTNPNAKWDWYELGGRWTGFLKLVAGSVGTVGSPGLMTTPAREGYADAALIGKVDVEGMRAEQGARAAERFDRLAPILRDARIPSWSEILEKHGDDIDAARREYHDDPVYKALVAKDRDLHWEWDLRAFLCNGNRDEFVARARRGALVTYAVVKGGEWYQRGEMGWFGMAKDEIDEETWATEFEKLIDGLPPETLISVFDCHI